MITINEQTFSVLLPDATTVVPIDGSLTLDEIWTPYIQARLTIPRPSSLTPFNPLQTPPPRVIVTVQQDFTDSDLVSWFTTAFGAGTIAVLTTAFGAGTIAAITAAHNRPWVAGETRRRIRRSFNLGIRSRSVGDDDTLVLELASDEALLQDIAPLKSPKTSGAPAAGGDYLTLDGIVPPTLYEAVNAVLVGVGLIAPYDFVATLDKSLTDFTEGPWFPSASYGIPWEAGTNAWDFLTPLLESAGARLWCDENRVWRLEAPNTNNSGSITLDSSTNLTGFTDQASRDADWYDAVVIKYTWTRTNGTSGIAYDSAMKNYVGGAYYSRTYSTSRDLGLRSNTFVPPTGAAATLLAQVLVLGRSLTPVRSVSDFSAASGASVSATLPDTTVLSGRIASVGWDFANREMTLSTRNIT